MADTARNGFADLLTVAERVIAQAEPGEEIEVAVGTGATTTVRAYGGEVEELSVADSAGIGVRVIVDGRQGFASAGSLAPDIVDEVLAEARDNMPFAVADEHVKLAVPDGVDAVPQDLWDDGLADMSTDRKVALAIELERRVRDADPRISGVRSAGYSDRASHSVIASTAGISTTNRSTAASLGVLALARDGDDTQTGAGSDVARGPQDLDLAKAADEAVSRATALLGATQPQSRRVTLVLEPRLAAALLSIIGGMLSGERVLKGRTPFADRVGETIAVPELTMVDDPTDAASFGARMYDGEGLAGRRNALIADGVLQGFLHNATSASRAGTVSTASAVRGLRSTPAVGWHALAVASGSSSLDDLIAGIDDGLLVHAMNGLHSGVNPVSGDFSVGTVGITIRNGTLAEPVREATIASTLPRLLQDICGLGAEIEHLPSGVSCPALVIGDVSLSGS